jgi:hypothetical protein
MSDAIADALYIGLADAAESARWAMADIPWEKIDRAAVTPELCELVRESAFAELTTATATRRFLTDLGDDTDFTHWMSVWFYEETRHPQVLLRWLHHVGITVDEEFMRRGRGAAPFMKSRMGTLVTNIISEMVAAASYGRLADICEEPVLAAIARNLSADEARHAASFYAFARRHLERSRDPEGDRRDALKVVYAWFNDNSHVRHPVNEFRVRTGAVSKSTSVVPRERIIELIGTLTGHTIDRTDDVLAEIRASGSGGEQR